MEYPNSDRLVRDMTRVQNGVSILSYPTYYEPHGVDTRQILMKQPPALPNFSAYSSNYVQNMVLNMCEYGYAQASIYYKIASTTCVNNARTQLTWTGDGNYYDTAGFVASGTVSLWSSGVYEFNYSVNFDTAPNNYTYAECWLRQSLSGVLVGDDNIGNTRISFGGTGTAHHLRYHRVVFCDVTLFNQVVPIIQVNTATNPVTIFGGFWQAKLLVPSDVRA